jgi:hypothetical protein
LAGIPFFFPAGLLASELGFADAPFLASLAGFAASFFAMFSLLRVKRVPE